MVGVDKMAHQRLVSSMAWMLDTENLSKLQPTKLVSDAVLDYYADQYSKNGLRGTSE